MTSRSSWKLVIARNRGGPRRRHEIGDIRGPSPRAITSSREGRAEPGDELDRGRLWRFARSLTVPYVVSWFTPGKLSRSLGGQTTLSVLPSQMRTFSTTLL